MYYYNSVTLKCQQRIGEFIMFDYHTHSHFSADCSTPMEEMVRAAIERGLIEIVFTEHIDYDYPDKDFIFEFDLLEYEKSIKALQKKYGESIHIKKGVELGVQPYLLEQYKQLMSEEQFDFVICSMHTTDKKGLHSGDLFKGRTVEEAYQIYYEELLYCIKNFDSYHVLGHIDLVKRYSIDHPAKDPFHDIISEIFKVIIPKGKGIEINTSGVRYGLPNAMPSPDILTLYKQCGGEVLTLGSDAHRISELAFQFRESLELLTSLGFKYVTTFDKQQPMFHSIDMLV